MQLGLTFTALLASLTALSVPVEAAPVRRGQSVSLPLQQAHALRSDIPAEVVSIAVALHQPVQIAYDSRTITSKPSSTRTAALTVSRA
jgi:hypothetical protein